MCIYSDRVCSSDSIRDNSIAPTIFEASGNLNLFGVLEKNNENTASARNQVILIRRKSQKE